MDDEAAKIDATISDRNCRPFVKVYDGFSLDHLRGARPVVADRHGRFWRYDADDQQLTLIHDPNAASF